MALRNARVSAPALRTTPHAAARSRRHRHAGHPRDGPIRLLHRTDGQRQRRLHLRLGTSPARRDRDLLARAGDPGIVDAASEMKRDPRAERRAVRYQVSGFSEISEAISHQQNQLYLVILSAAL